MKSVKPLLLTIGLFIGLSHSANAVPWANKFVQFELPQNWRCLLEGAEWVCQNEDKTKKREAIIVLAAKLQGAQDTLDQYLDYLKKAKRFTTPSGKAVSSQVRYARNKTIQDHTWVDSLQLESEVPGFYTRYLATVKEGIGILVTYSVNKAKYSEYQDEFESMVSSLKAFRKEGGLNAAPATSDLFAQGGMPARISAESVFAPSTNEDQPKSEGGIAALLQDPVIFYGGSAVAILLLMIVFRAIKKRR
jgi:hypothetical protein